MRTYPENSEDNTETCSLFTDGLKYRLFLTTCYMELSSTNLELLDVECPLENSQQNLLQLKERCIIKTIAET
jgi:hypothetical protein